MMKRLDWTTDGPGWLWVCVGVFLSLLAVAKQTLLPDSTASFAPTSARSQISHLPYMAIKSTRASFHLQLGQEARTRYSGENSWFIASNQKRSSWLVPLLSIGPWHSAAWNKFGAEVCREITDYSPNLQLTLWQQQPFLRFNAHPKMSKSCLIRSAWLPSGSIWGWMMLKNGWVDPRREGSRCSQPVAHPGQWETRGPLVRTG